MTAKQSSVLRLLNHYTRGGFNLYWSLAGDHARERVEILSAIRGVKVPQAKAGITALTAAVHECFGVQGDCQAQREDRFVEWAKNEVLLAEPQP